MAEENEVDLTIVGGGPAGLAAAINGASEGIKVALFDSGPSLGGQAAKSSLIENYPGFKDGISGERLIQECVGQAQKFKTDILCPVSVVGIRTEKSGHHLVMGEDGSLYRSRAVIVSAGLSYRRLNAKNLGAFAGTSVFYGTPAKSPSEFDGKTVCIIGGANSAGQAAMHLATNPNVKIKLLVRKHVGDQMSQYLIDRIKMPSNIEVLEGVEVTEVQGNGSLQEICIYDKARNEYTTMPADFMMIFIGATPKTFWLNGTVALDPKNFILTGPKLIELGHWKDTNRAPLSFETNVPGIFACGDVRTGSTKRIASAVGEGSVALQMCHDYFGLMNGSLHS